MVELYVKLIPSSKTLTLELDCTSVTVEHIKTLVYEKTGIHPDEQRLIARTSVLMEDHKTLNDYNVRSDHTIHMVPRKRVEP
jgi:hypothetical protein